MKPVHVLMIHWGTEEGTGVAFGGVPTSTPDDGVELAELTVSYPVSDQEAGRVSEAVTAGSRDVLVLLLSGHAVVQKGATFFELASKNRWRLPVVVVCPAAEPHELASLSKLGALEVLTMPWGSKEILARLRVLHGRAREETSPVAQLRARLGLEHVIGESPAFVALIQQLPSIAKYDVSLLILGETGAGKEVFARAVHYRGPRASKPFIPINCGAIPVELLENEFFGHESGAFTSANGSRRGVLKEADGGTLFLDEVDCLPPLAQVKLLRFLQDGQFRPLGSASVCTADVRVIAASNANLAEALAVGRFRKDLYYRLNVLSLKLPPLREREGDIILLARHFLAKYRDKFHAPAREFSPAALQKLLCHSWPGNVRELENVVQRAVVLAEGVTLQAEHIWTGDGAVQPPAPPQSFQQLKAQAIAQFEQNYVRRMLLIHGGNIAKAAQGAGQDRRAFWELMRKHGLTARLPATLTGPTSPGENPPKPG
ncbi:MAG: sigma-54-dependent Fis family transcriptional regulator [Verrucomicrobia bacterium]|nr:sigma-54-dependent Fis family transcriptional regulator [Verrucomicrobiota bacterium]